jgi:hypothetical protein
MDRIDLAELEHTVERVWVAEPVQGRQAVIRVGRLADGRWWVSRDDGRHWTDCRACGDEHQAEAAADRWSRRSGLRWRRVHHLGR